MQVTLPVSGQTATLRDFIPHKVVVQSNEALYRGVQIKSHAVSPTKEELQVEFGIGAIQALDSLTDESYDKRLVELKEEFLRRKIEMEGMTLGNVEEANLRKVIGVTEAVAGVVATREIIEQLPHQDVGFLLECYEKIYASTEQKKRPAQSAS